MSAMRSFSLGSAARARSAPGSMTAAAPREAAVRVEVATKRRRVICRMIETSWGIRPFPNPCGQYPESA
jgi:hypothetical protein